MFDFNNLLDQYLKNIEPGNPELPDYLRAYLHIVETYGYGTEIKEGRIELLGWNIAYRSLGATIPNFIDQILIRRLNDFIPETDSPLIYDCGANIGFSSLAYKRRSPNARIVAFEPDPAFIPLLRANLETNGAGDVEVVDAAVWVENGSSQWLLEGRDGSRLHLEKDNDTEHVLVRTIDFGGYLDQAVDLVKLDIEGAEYEVIQHIKNKLKNIKSMSIECHIDQKHISSFGDMLKTLQEAGFQVSINSFGIWRDLIRQPAIAKDHHEGYLVVSAWRKTFTIDSSHTSWVPSAGSGPVVDYFNQLKYILSQVEDIRKASELHEEEIKKAFNLREEELIRYIKPFVLGNIKAIRKIEIEKPIQNNNGLAWITPFSALREIADNAEATSRSRILLFEDDQLLNPPHAIHDDIRRLGGGRYSHWEDKLYFSTSDGSDPNGNGRTYRVVYLA